VAASAKQIAEVLAGMRAESARLVAASALASDGRGAAARLPAGSAALDALLGGGLVRGRIVELSGPRTSGRMSAVLAMTAAVQGRGELVAFVDVADALDPRSAVRAGVELPRLLWVRPRSIVDGLKAADWVLDVGGFGLVVLYLAGSDVRVVAADARGWRRRGDVVRGDAPWVKLARRAEGARAAVVVVADRPLVGTLGAVALVTERGRGCWLGGGLQPRLLDGVRGRIAVVRNKLGPSAGSAELPLIVDVNAPPPPARQEEEEAVVPPSLIVVPA
jgi:hypothetical protein